MAKSSRGGKIGASSSGAGGGSSGTGRSASTSAGKPTTFITQSQIDKMSEPEFLQLMRHSRVANIELVSDTQKKAMDRLTAQVKEKGDSYTSPIFKLNNDGNIEFEYKGTEIRKREKGGKMQSATKADTVEVTKRYYGVIRVSGDKMRIERRSETESEKLIKRGRL